MQFAVFANWWGRRSFEKHLPYLCPLLTFAYPPRRPTDNHLAHVLASRSVFEEAKMASRPDSSTPEDDLERKHYMEVGHRNVVLQKMVPQEMEGLMKFPAIHWLFFVYTSSMQGLAYLHALRTCRFGMPSSSIRATCKGKWIAPGLISRTCRHHRARSCLRSFGNFMTGTCCCMLVASSSFSP